MAHGGRRPRLRRQRSPRLTSRPAPDPNRNHHPPRLVLRPPVTTKHFGVYGVWLQAGRLVLVRKSRGPYDGLLDLPGGSPEAGESEVDTLRRELREECGVRARPSARDRDARVPCRAGFGWPSHRLHACGSHHAGGGGRTCRAGHRGGGCSRDHARHGGRRTEVLSPGSCGTSPVPRAGGVTRTIRTYTGW
ncbi:NUDIX domain-containing protein [Kribbella albertanoniae]|uniref:NUDIX domain-containing protein n=1 Tax=Kribbella albertanoniae TaxID=1266829 RepID=A0A4R4PIZ7_9ACTN|nr:NUDIX domain-containing protein [Kribbella albertanoniae]